MEKIGLLSVIRFRMAKLSAISIKKSLLAEPIKRKPPSWLEHYIESIGSCFFKKRVPLSMISTTPSALFMIKKIFFVSFGIVTRFICVPVVALGN